MNCIPAIFSFFQFLIGKEHRILVHCEGSHTDPSVLIYVFRGRMLFLKNCKRYGSGVHGRKKSTGMQPGGSRIWSALVACTARLGAALMVSVQYVCKRHTRHDTPLIFWAASCHAALDGLLHISGRRFRTFTVLHSYIYYTSRNVHYINPKVQQLISLGSRAPQIIERAIDSLSCSITAFNCLMARIKPPS